MCLIYASTFNFQNDISTLQYYYLGSMMKSCFLVCISLLLLETHFIVLGTHTRLACAQGPGFNPQIINQKVSQSMKLLTNQPAFYSENVLL